MVVGSQESWRGEGRSDGCLVISFPSLRRTADFSTFYLVHFSRSRASGLMKAILWFMPGPWGSDPRLRADFRFP